MPSIETPLTPWAVAGPWTPRPRPVSGCSWARALLLCLALSAPLEACGEAEAPPSTAPDAGLDGNATTDTGPAAPDIGGAPDILDPSPDASTVQDAGLPEITVPDIHFDAGSSTAAEVSEEGDILLEEVEEGPPGPVHVLFIGNSYTSGNNLKGWVADLAEAAAYEPGLTTEAITQGGAWLMNHWENASTMEAIATGGFTHVVLQEQSTLPLMAKGQFLLSATALAGPIHEAAAIPVFFETWAREEGNVLYETDLAGYTPETMQAALRDAYMTASSANDGLYAPVGDVWEATLAAHPEIDLFSGDGSHASQAGTYLAACVFYEVLTGESPVGIPLGPASLTDEEIATLQGMVGSAE